MQNKCIKRKPFELKYGKKKLSNVSKCKKIRLVLAIFFFLRVCTELVLHCIKPENVAIFDFNKHLTMK